MATKEKQVKEPKPCKKCRGQGFVTLKNKDRSYRGTELCKSCKGSCVQPV